MSTMAVVRMAETLPAQEEAVRLFREGRLEEMVRLFLAEQDVSPKSKDTYSRSLRQFVSWLHHTGRSLRLQREDVLAFKTWLTETKKAATTISVYLTAVRRLFEWLEAKKVYPNVSRGIRGAKRPHGHRKDCLTVEQLREALEAIDRESLEGLRDYAAFNLMARTGLRTVELSRATVGDIRQESGEPVLFVQGKGRDTKDAFVLLQPKAMKPLREYLSARKVQSEEEPLFCSQSDRNRGQALSTRSISRLVKEALRRIGLDDRRLTAHSLRHTTATLAVLGGATPEQAQAMMRHSDIRTTLGYFHNRRRIQEAAERHVDF